MKESVSQMAAIVKRALLEGGEVLRRGFPGERRVSYKTETSPVTQVDRESERRIINLIKRKFPAHTFLAEESAFLKKGDLGKSRAGRYRWVIDPLDGTVNFMHRIPQSCVSVAVECAGVVLAGGVYDPFRKELFLAVKGQGATMNGRKIRVSKETRPIRSLLVTGFPYNHQQRAAYHAKLLVPFLKEMADVRRFGAAALDLAWVACGRVDVYWELGLQPWDVAAGGLLVQESGGRLTDFSGKPINLDKPEKTLATNSFLHSHALKLLSS